MKRIIASAGLLALGISGTQATGMVANAPMNKPWSLSATLRGFYDDNPAMVEHNAKDSFGFDVSPSVGVNLNGGQTTFGAKYTYTFRYYADRPEQGDSSDSSYDHIHDFSMWLTHAFNERFSVDASDRLLYTQEPTLGTDTSTINNNGNYLLNDGQIKFHAQASRLLEIVLGYQNLLFNYEESAYSQTLDRLEHFANIDFRWQVTPQTVAVLGYEFKAVRYDHSGAEGNNNDAHIVTIGADHNFSPNLMGSFRVGGQYTDYYNNSDADSELTPYAASSLRYTYRPNSYLEVGAQHHRNQTDANATDAATTLVHATLSHSFTPQFVGTLSGQAQHQEYNGGPDDGEEDWIYYLSLMFEYHFSPHFSASMGYNFDKVDSDIPYRSYDRNRVFMGVTASY